MKNAPKARKLLDDSTSSPSTGKTGHQAYCAEQKAENSRSRPWPDEWHENFKHKWTERHAKTVMRRMEQDIFPEIGLLPITDIKPFHILDALKKVQKRGAFEPAHRLRQYCSQIFRYAIINEKAQINPAAEIGMVLKPVVKKHYACIDIKEIPDLLGALNRNDARLHADTRQAIRLLMLTFVRTKELIEAPWERV
jgi:integrase